MERSNISFLRNSLDENAATLYTLEDGTWRADHDYENDAFVLHGGGALKSTLGDMLKYVSMYLNEGKSQDEPRSLTVIPLRKCAVPDRS